MANHEDFMIWSILFVSLLAPASAEVDRVVVVRNDESSISRAVADDYVQRRGVANLLEIHCQDSATGADRETISYAHFKNEIETPLRAFLTSHPHVDFVVLTKGVPIRIEGAPGLGVDANTTALFSPVK